MDTASQTQAIYNMQFFAQAQTRVLDKYINMFVPELHDVLSFKDVEPQKFRRNCLRTHVQ